MLDARDGATEPLVLAELARGDVVRTTVPDPDDPELGLAHLRAGDELCVDCAMLASGFGAATASILARQRLKYGSIRCQPCFEDFQTSKK